MENDIRLSFQLDLEKVGIQNWLAAIRLHTGLSHGSAFQCIGLAQ